MAKNSAVGLDIGTRTVNVAHISRSRGGYTVDNFGGVELPPDAVREGEVLDADTVGASIRELVATAGIRTKEVWLGIANQRVVVRQIDLPWMEPSELRTSLRFQVQEYIPIPVEEAELDFHVLDDYETEDGARMLRLLLVAAHKDMVQSHVRAAQAAGLRPVGVDLNPFAMLRSTVGDGAIEPASEVLVDVGAGVTNILVHEAGVPRFVRILVLGGDDITEALASGLSIPNDEAEALKKRTGLSDADDPAASIIRDRVAQFVDEVRNSLDYFQAQTGGTRITRVILTGGGALLGGIADRLAAVLRLPVDVADPFSELATGKGVRFGEHELRQVGPVLTTSVGLALGGLA